MASEDTDPGEQRGWPRVATSIAVFRGPEVLLIERGKGALKGQWSLPGGHIDPGERSRTAALRELMEETGVTADLVGLVDVHEVILQDRDGRLAAHYVIAVYCGRWRSGEPVRGSDAAAARFVPVADITRLPLTEGADRLIARAQFFVAAARP